MDVQPDGPVADVPHVEQDAFVVAGVVAPGNLPQPGDAGLDAREDLVVVAVIVDLSLHDGARPDHGEFACDDVEELRQLVEAGLAENAPDGGDARVVFELEVSAPLGGELRIVGEDLFELVVGVSVHRAELPDVDRASVFAEAVGAVQDRALAGELHDERQDQKHRDQHHHADAGEDELEDGFREARDRTQKLVADLQSCEFAQADRRAPRDGDADVVGHEQDLPEVFDVVAQILRNRLRRETADEKFRAGACGDRGCVGERAEAVLDGGIVVDEPGDPEPEMRVVPDFLLQFAAAFSRAGDEDGYLADVQAFEELPDQVAHEADEEQVQARADRDDHARIMLRFPGEGEVAEEQQIRDQDGIDAPPHLLHGIQRHARRERIAVVEPHDRRQQDEDEQERPHGDIGGHLVVAAHGVIDPGRAEPADGQRRGVRQHQKQNADPSGGHNAASFLRNTVQKFPRPIGTGSLTGVQLLSGGAAGVSAASDT